jgi:hypothetical protein
MQPQQDQGVEPPHHPHHRQPHHEAPAHPQQHHDAPHWDTPPAPASKSAEQLPLKSTRVWVALIVAPLVMLAVISLVQFIAHFVFASQIDETDSGIDVFSRILNVVNALFGVISIILMVTIPVWIGMLGKTVDDNNAIKAQAGIAVRKNKTPAVLLAVFLGGFAWAYTYSKDAHKFWINFGLALVTFGFWAIAGWVWAIIDMAQRDEQFYAGYYYQQPPTLPTPLPPAPVQQ